MKGVAAIYGVSSPHALRILFRLFLRQFYIKSMARQRKFHVAS